MKFAAFATLVQQSHELRSRLCFSQDVDDILSNYRRQPTAVDARLVRGSGDHPSQADSFGVSTWMGDRLAVC